MNGPAHYREAERLAQWADDYDEDAQPDTVHIQAGQLAQVHAMLANAAAVIAGTAHKMEPADRHEWQRATDPGYDAGQAPGAAL